MPSLLKCGRCQRKLSKTYFYLKKCNRYGYSTYCKYCYHLKERYRITYEEYIFLFKKQKNRCGICKENIKNHPSVDHDHKTNKVRGLLCRQCNFGLGHFKDSIVYLQRAINYLNANYSSQ